MKHLMQSMAAIWLMCWGCGIGMAQEGRIVVHEWGTFTSFQDEQGKALHHINTDDEPVPAFVHQIGRKFEFRPTEMPPRSSQGAPHAHPSVTMRLETPVIYFHLPQGMKPTSVDVDVEFRGGWLTQFYPKGLAKIDGQLVNESAFPDMTAGSVGGLSWRGVRVGADGAGPTTDQKVWLAPRKVDAEMVRVNEQSEKFLFYRGVGCIDAPLRVVRGSNGNELMIEPPEGVSQQLRFAALWLAEIKADGAVAYRELARPGATAATFKAEDYASENLGRLRDSMRRVLIEEGLFDDEARALLETWELSYFQSPGLRLFFVVPQKWTDRVLPLKLSQPADVKRVMVGRIEIVTPRQRELIEKITAAAVPDLGAVSKAMRELRGRDADAYNALASGRGDVANLGVDVPQAYRDFLALGRFRTALLLNKDPAQAEISPRLGDFRMAVEIPEVKIGEQLRARREAEAR